jgi:hypothetical protein
MAAIFLGKSALMNAIHPLALLLISSNAVTMEGRLDKSWT